MKNNLVIAIILGIAFAAIGTYLVYLFSDVRVRHKQEIAMAKAKDVADSIYYSNAMHESPPIEICKLDSLNKLLSSSTDLFEKGVDNKYNELKIK